MATMYDVYLSVPCTNIHCGAAIDKPCYNGKRKMKDVHVHRIYNYHRRELMRRRKFRERYLAEWLRLYGDIFKE